MKVLNIDDMLEAAMECGLPTYDEQVAAIEAAASALATALAEHLKIKTSGAEWEGKAFAGTCASFYPSKKRQKCPAVIDAGDPGGDWELQPYEE